MENNEASCSGVHLYVPFIMTRTWLQHWEMGVECHLEDTSVSTFQGLLGEEMQQFT